MKLDLTVPDVHDVIAAVASVHSKKPRKATRHLLDKINAQLATECKTVPEGTLYIVRYHRTGEVDFADDDTLETHIRAKGWRELWHRVEADEHLQGCEVVAVEKCDG